MAVITMPAMSLSSLLQYDMLRSADFCQACCKLVTGEQYAYIFNESSLEVEHLSTAVLVGVLFVMYQHMNAVHGIQNKEEFYGRNDEVECTGLTSLAAR